MTNFRGIELRDFAAEIARLALVIAEYQCDVSYRGQKEALKDVLPLSRDNWITQGNALRLDWLTICPPTGIGAKVTSDDLFETPLDQAEIDFENEGGKTYICGNPPYKGSQTQTREQKSDLAAVFDGCGISAKQIDYVGGWFMKAALYSRHASAETGLVSTNSICQGRVVSIIWPAIFATGSQIHFAHTSFKWSNLASQNAGVTVAIVGLSSHRYKNYRIYETNEYGEQVTRAVDHISPYLVAGENITVNSRRNSLSGLTEMSFGNMPVEGGNLLLTQTDLNRTIPKSSQRDLLVRPIYGSAEFIRGITRYCLWITDENLDVALSIAEVARRINEVRNKRETSKDAGTRNLAKKPHQFREMHEADTHSVIVPSVSSESREYFPVGLIDNRTTVSNLAFALYDAPLWNLALIASKLHLVWIATVCGKLKTDFRYSNTLGWNTFPVPKLTEQNKADLTRCAEDILLAREAHFPATIADLYKPEAMPENLRHAHERNDDTLERIYIGRRFKNDTERLEKLFEMYARMTASESRRSDSGKRTTPPT